MEKTDFFFFFRKTAKKFIQHIQLIFRSDHSPVYWQALELNQKICELMLLWHLHHEQPCKAVTKKNGHVNLKYLWKSEGDTIEEEEGWVGEGVG